MADVKTLIDLIGNTPMVQVKNMDTGTCNLYLKMEGMNPGASIKDRVALNIIETAERDGLLKPGYTIIEASAGNTAMGLALIGKLKGYKSKVVILDKMNNNKILHLKALGAEVLTARSDVGPDHPEHYIAVAKKLADEQKIDIKYFNIIYEAIDHVERSLSGLLEPDIKETVLGSAEIQKVFKVSTAGKIAGSKVISGEIKSKSKARIIRDGVVVYNGEISSIFREKNQVKEAGTGLECGISLKDFIDFKEKDVIESFISEEIQRSI